MRVFSVMFFTVTAAAAALLCVPSAEASREWTSYRQPVRGGSAHYLTKGHVGARHAGTYGSYRFYRQGRGFSGSYYRSDRRHVVASRSRDVRDSYRRLHDSYRRRYDEVALEQTGRYRVLPVPGGNLSRRVQRGVIWNDRAFDE